ncbi:MAG: hypothetical protein M0C28_46790 [Candidatus Moduliflexus flocculans]|nr:hypothetical protein [Candidatus Moduliflexus flocculans]
MKKSALTARKAGLIACSVCHLLCPAHRRSARPGPRNARAAGRPCTAASPTASPAPGRW